MRMRTSLPKLTFGNYVKPGDDAGNRRHRRPHGQPPRPLALLGRVRRNPRHLERANAAQGHPASPEAAEAVNRGVDCVIVSNHGGRQLDGAAASLDALPGVVEAVAGKIPVLMDAASGAARCGEGAGARRLLLPHRAAAALGGCRSRARRASPTCSTSTGARSTASWA